jgi:hypothetical protein
VQGRMVDYLLIAVHLTVSTPMSLIWSCGNLVRVINDVTSLLRGYQLIRGWNTSHKCCSCIFLLRKLSARLRARAREDAQSISGILNNLDDERWQECRSRVILWSNSTNKPCSYDCIIFLIKKIYTSILLLVYIACLYFVFYIKVICEKDCEALIFTIN